MGVWTSTSASSIRTPADLELSVQTWMAVIVATARLVSPERPGPKAARTTTSAAGLPVDGTRSAAMTWAALSANVHRDSLGIRWSTATVSVRVC